MSLVHNKLHYIAADTNTENTAFALTQYTMFVMSCSLNEVSLNKKACPLNSNILVMNYG